MTAEGHRSRDESRGERHGGGVFADTMLWWAGAYLLSFVGLVHLLQADEMFASEAYLGLSFVAYFLAASFLAVVIARNGSRWAWILSAALCVLAVIGLLVSRTAGLPGYPEAVGQWFNLPAATALVLELSFLALSPLALTRKGHRTVEAEQEKLDLEAARSPERLERAMVEARSRMEPDLRDLRAHADPRLIKNRVGRGARARLGGLLGLLGKAGPGSSRKR
ncbi:hypothetical protein [Rubrobacter aplysinae]|uniref:hypothetical protein n=1 Tax=Rubrobacter aplysinae TaxID=909625 RepID=UPI00128DB177|nr:hypothetical protein [Rubrobacter aplysinae]